MRITLLDGWVEIERRRVVRGQHITPLTEKEAQLLGRLARHPGQPISRDTLYADVWGDRSQRGSRTLDVTVRRLRAKIEPAPQRPQLVQTVTNIGYRFVPPPLTQAGAGRISLRPGPRAHVPLDPGPLVGRDDEALVLLRCLHERGLACVHGLGGVGKSRLLRSVAHTWSARTGGAAWWVPVDGATDADSLAERVAHTLSLRLSGPDRAQNLRERLQRMGPLLLVLDGADHLGQSFLEALTTWGTAPDGLQLAISRRLPPPGDAWPTLRLRPLPGAAAEALFRARMRERLPGYEAPDEAVAALVEAVGGLPLALKLAAARVRVLGLVELRARLVRGEPVLKDQGDDSAHGALDRVLQQSWELLSDPLRAAAVTLAQIHGPFDLSLAEAMLGPCAETLEALVSAGWVEPVPGDPPLYQLLDCVRDHLQRAPSFDGSRQRLAQALAAQAEQHVDPLFGASTVEGCTWLHRRAVDLEAALAAGHRAQWLVLAASVGAALIGDDRGSQARSALLGDQGGPLVDIILGSALSEPPEERERALDRAETYDLSPRERASVQMGRAGQAVHHGDWARAEALLLEAFETFEAIDDAMGLATAAMALANTLAVFRGDPEGAAAIRARGLARLGERAPLSRWWLMASGAPLSDDERRTRVSTLREGVEVARSAGDRMLLCRLLEEIAFSALRLGEVEEVEDAALAVLAEAPYLQDQKRAIQVKNCGLLLKELGWFDVAADALATGIDDLLERCPNPPDLRVARNATALAVLQMDSGRMPEARTALALARRYAEAEPALLAGVLPWEGVACRLQGGEAEPCWRQALALARAHGAMDHAATAMVLLSTLGTEDADALLQEAHTIALARSDASLAQGAEAVWVARGHRPWTEAPPPSPPERWSSLVRMVRRLLAL